MAITKISPSVVDFDSALVVSPTLTIGDATAEDTKIVFDGNAQDYYVGLDDSADELIIGNGSTVGSSPAITIDSSENTTFGGQVIAPNGATSGYYLKQTGGTATPRVTNDGNEWTILRPGASGADVAINNYANSANRVIFRDEGNVEIGDGNLVVASGHGIDFSATGDGTGATVGSEVLDDYEEGTWSPGIGEGSVTIDRAHYTKIGRFVHFAVLATGFTNRTSANQVVFNNLPFPVLADHAVGTVFGAYNDETNAQAVYVTTNEHVMFYALHTSNHLTMAHNDFNNSLSGLYFFGTYTAA